jgi:hypothetical protein
MRAAASRGARARAIHREAGKVNVNEKFAMSDQGSVTSYG